MDTFSTRLRKLRMEAGYTQVALCRACNLGILSVWKYENGQTMPSAESLIALADVLHTTTDYLLCRTTKRGN